jgi:valyl-tRNA synthetase
VLAVRQIPSENNVPPGKAIEVLVRPAPGSGDAFTSEAATIGRLARANVRVVDEAPQGAAAHAIVAGGTEVVVPLAGLIDVERECERLRLEVADLEKQIGSRQARLDNPKYVERAPAHVVASDRAILDEMKGKRDQLVDKVRSLCGV